MLMENQNCLPVASLYFGLLEFAINRKLFCFDFIYRVI